MNKKFWRGPLHNKIVPVENFGPGNVLFPQQIDVWDIKGRNLPVPGKNYPKEMRIALWSYQWNPSKQRYEGTAQ